jgi:hypothetical protein
MSITVEEDILIIQNHIKTDVMNEQTNWSGVLCW